MDAGVCEHRGNKGTGRETGSGFRPRRWHRRQDLSAQGKAREMMRKGKEFKLTRSHSGIWELSKNF